MTSTRTTSFSWEWPCPCESYWRAMKPMFSRARPRTIHRASRYTQVRRYLRSLGNNKPQDDHRSPCSCGPNQPLRYTPAGPAQPPPQHVLVHPRLLETLELRALPNFTQGKVPQLSGLLDAIPHVDDASPHFVAAILPHIIHPLHLFPSLCLAMSPPASACPPNWSSRQPPLPL